MKLTIGAKLGIAFGTVILLLAVSAGTAYYNISRMRVDLNHVLDQAVPTVHSCNRLLADLNQASSGLRGYLVMDQNETRANEFKAENLDGWQGAMDELGLLAKYAVLDDGTVARQQVDRITQLVRVSCEDTINRFSRLRESWSAGQEQSNGGRGTDLGRREYAPVAGNQAVRGANCQRGRRPGKR